ncbi:SPOR domain-containing protein [Wenzhouxiangella sp. XN24]|uniref:SPOR domain-containing protein n=1 Tax=Wenzhouxiangella sp. XN24 TaxID=2713569 RepID=UPI0013ECE8EA|nr:SPOR domain-containing protein [Wenzhouxiangella sp. XN24]NGX17647.1 SPOR domain-containing protein [Wenzhouxiangella sp. XN24]
MARDYKRRQRTRKPPTPGWMWFLGGLAVGLSVALFIYLRDAGPGPEGAPVATRATQPADTADPSAGAGDAPGADSPTEGGFDFYTMLPGLEVIVPQEDTRARDAPEAGAMQATALAPGRYWIQAGSFRSYRDADRRKAELALLGLGSSIQDVAIDGQTWHRVRVGPLPDAARAEAMRQRLADNGIGALALREREEP